MTYTNLAPSSNFENCLAIDHKSFPLELHKKNTCPALTQCCTLYDACTRGGAKAVPVGSNHRNAMASTKRLEKTHIGKIRLKNESTAALS